MQYVVEGSRAVLGIGLLLAGNFVCVWAALRLARAKGRAPKPWMWATAILGVVPLVALAFARPRFLKISPTDTV